MLTKLKSFIKTILDKGDTSNENESKSIMIADEFKAILHDEKLQVVDVGGAANLQPHWHKFIGNADFYIYEPHEGSYRDLVSKVNRYSHPKDFHYINEALSEFGGERTLNLTNVPTGSSLLEFIIDHPFHSKKSEYVYPIKKINISTKTLKESLDNNNVGGIDALKLDVQGAELEIIKGIDSKRLDDINVIELEVGLHKVYHNQTTFCAVEEFMKKNGFGLFDVRVNRINLPNHLDNTSYAEKYFNTHNQSPSLSSRIWEFDAIYFREAHWAIDNKVSKNRIARIIACYCVYNFFAEAIYLANKALNDNIISDQEYLIWKNAITNLNKREQVETKYIDQSLKKLNYLSWGQYTWASYPSN